MSASVLPFPTPDRQPPYAPEAEVSVLGGMLMDAEAVPVALELLDADQFYRDANRRVFAAMADLASRGVTVDPVTVSEHLRTSGDLEAVGGMAYLAELLGSVPTAANLAYHAGIVRDRATQRRLIDAGTRVVRLGYEPGPSVEAAVDAAQQTVAGVADDRGGEGIVWVKDRLWPVFQEVEARQREPGKLAGVPTGFPDLDRMTGGLRRRQLVLVAARPSMGKTSLAVSFALHAAVAEQTPVAFFSVEMATDEIVGRCLCHEAMADLMAMQQGRLSDSDYTQLAQAAGHLNTAPLYIDQTSAPTVLQIRSKVRRALVEHPDLSLVIVDHIGLLRGDGENRQNEVAGISRDLKALAKDLDVCVVALSQLSREPTRRADARPQLADLRDSGSLEQDADVVLMLHRPEYYLTATAATEQDVKGKAELLVRKQRNGPTGEVGLYFRAECARFESVTHQPEVREYDDWTADR